MTIFLKFLSRQRIVFGLLIRFLKDLLGRKTMTKALLTARTDIKKVIFSKTLCLQYNGNSEDIRCLTEISDYLIKNNSTIAFFGAGKFCKYFFSSSPEIKRVVSVIIDCDPKLQGQNIDKIPIISPESLPPQIKTVFLCSTHWREIENMKKSLSPSIKTITLDILKDINWKIIPSRAWVPKIDSIYPIEIPDIEFLPGQDVILLDFPARSLAQLPVGFGYVHDALKRDGIKFQTIDTDIIIYHRYHSDRILDGIPVFFTPIGNPIPGDPWLPVHYLEWEKEDFVDFFQKDIDEIAEKLVQAHPKILACSIQQVNLTFAKRVIAAVRKILPDITIIVGGMSCLQPGAAKFIFPLADYTIVGEADLIIGPLVKKILTGEKPFDLSGVWSRYDSPNREFVPGSLPTDLDLLGHPRFEWTDIKLYRNWNGYQLTPIVGSRGCSWSRCHFCGERFNWRKRSPEKVVDDLEYFNRLGCVEFVFNESNLHGDPQLIERMCDEIIRRGLKIRMTAQLRCHGKVNKQYFIKLAKAGFVCLRFGVDGWSLNTIKLQRKGYTKDMIRNNLRDATEAGIFTETNIVVGVPGETEADVDEAIQFIIELKPYIGRMAFINPMMLFRGSDYWEDPDTYGIIFRTPKDELYNRYPVAIPDTSWYSVNPFIDADVRFNRYRRIAKTLIENGVKTGDWANFTTDEVQRKKADLASTHNPGELLQIIPEEFESGPCLTQSYRGFNIVQYREYFYGCPVSLGHINVSLEKERTQPDVVIGESEIHVKRVIDEIHSKQETEQPFFVLPKDNEFIGISTSKESFSLIDFKPDDPSINASSPRLIGHYKGYNLVSYDDFIYAAPLSLGPLDLNIKQNRENSRILVALSESTVRNLIDKNPYYDTPTLIETYKKYNLVRYQNQVLVVPIFLGPLDLTDENTRKISSILIAADEQKARELIEQR